MYGVAHSQLVEHVIYCIQCKPSLLICATHDSVNYLVPRIISLEQVDKFASLKEKAGRPLQ